MNRPARIVIGCLGVSLILLGLWWTWSPAIAPVVDPPSRPLTPPIPTPETVDPSNPPPSAVGSGGGAVSTIDLRRLRRSFAGEPRHLGTAGPVESTIVLQGAVIHTGSYPPFTPSPRLQPSSVYWVQFTRAIQPEWKEQIEQMGGVLHGYLPVNTLLVSMTTSTAKHLMQKAFVQWIHPVMPETRIDPFLGYLSNLPPDQAPASVPVTVTTYEPGAIAALAAYARAEGLPMISEAAGKRWGWITLELPLDRLSTLAAMDEVQWIEEWVAPALLNDYAVRGDHLRVTNLWTTHGLNGEGQIIGHADTGLDMGSMTNLHPDFAGRVLAGIALGRTNNWADSNGHGTHSAGSIFGSGLSSTGQFRGVAAAASLVHQSIMDAGGGLGGLPDDLNDLFRQAYDLGARVHSDSWGSDVYGAYTTSSRQSDEFMWDHPGMLLVFSAGNSGADWNGDGIVDIDSIGSPATAKNVLTVGAAENDRSPGSGGYSLYTYGWAWPWDYAAEPIRSDYVSASSSGQGQGLAAFSSRGPTDDGRIKPDVVAPGTDIVSVRSRYPGAGTGWGVHPNTNYMFNGGTSMSAPLIAGCAALIRQYYRDEAQLDEPSAALIKATMTQGARSLSPGQYGTNLTQEIPDMVPNVMEGWGQPDIEPMLYPADGTTWFFQDQKAGLSAPGDGDELVLYAATGMPVSVTLAYTDFPASAGAGKKLVNDLDLEIAAPDGAIHRPAYAGGFDRSNNIERVTFTPVVSGVYTARVTAFSVPEGPQPYALVARGKVTAAPIIEHEPLANQIVTNEPFVVAARILMTAGVSSNTSTLYWKHAGSTNGFSEVPMTESKGRIYQAVIPAQPNPSEILYYIRAESSGLVTFDPPQAPATPHRFLVTSPVLLTIAGDPAPVFAVEPPYGSLLVASGNMVRFSAPAYSNLYEGARLAVHHWEGEGSLPVQGTQLVFEALLQADSKLTWHWEYQYELISTTTLPGVAPTATWWFAWSSAQTPSALSEVTLGGQAYGFSGWWVDGTRQPNPTDAASLVASNLVMFGPRSAEARYLDAEEDIDGDGLPDWWEWFYFGGLTPDPVVDSDTDGFTNAKEYQDRTNPRNAGDTPQPPSVAHFPLQSPQSNPAPWEVRALVMDNHAVDQVTLYWTRNGDTVTNETTMGVTVSNMYEGIMPAPGTNADQFIYRIEARDAAGLKSVNGPFAFDVRYPRMAVTSGVTTGLLAGYQSATSVVVWVTNAGLADLAWTVQVYEQFDDIESGTNALTHAGLEDRWHIQQARFASPTNAWHFGAGPFGNYPDGADAALTLPAFTVPPDAILQFEHWARMEYDTDQRDDHYWDGGVIEVSTNGGLSFSQVTPIGGYPHRITENPDSPFAPETPCYGETDGWETGRVDLAHLAGAEVQVRFRFGSDRYVTEEGWYLDNVSLVVTNDLWWQWISVPGQGVLGAGSETGLVVEVTTAGFDPGEFRSGVLLARGNDPEVPRLWRVPVDLASSARLLEVTAEGPGTVVPAGEVYVNAGSTTSFWLEADTYFQIGAIYTNGYAAPVVPSNRTMGYVWTNVWSNGTLHIVFTEKLAAGWVPEWWLAEHGFTNQSPDAEAATDHDGDGMVTWQEYVARTDATNPASVALLMLSAKPEGTNGTVEWLSYTNETFRYRLESTENLPDGFGVVASNLPATPPVNAYTNAAPGFILYRVILDSGP